MSRQQHLETILSAQFNPIHLAVENESSNHNVPIGSESHFKIIIVSNQFDQLTHIARHRRVNEAVKNEFSNGLHALSMHLYTPDEWIKKNGAVPDSPKCKGGSRHNNKMNDSQAGQTDL